MSSNKKTCILLIEENAADVQNMERILKNSSVRYNLITSEGLYNGIEITQQREVDIVLLELNLTDSTGFKTLTVFLERVPQLPVLVVTKVNNEIIGNQSIKAGAQDFLVKGQFDGKLLGRSIRYALQRHTTTLKLEDTAKNLSISEKRFLDAQSMAHFGNFEMDIVNNSMKWTLEIFNIFGLRPNSINPTLSDYISYVHIDDKERVIVFFDEITESGTLEKIEHRIVQSDHTIRYVALNAKVFYDEITQKIILIGSVQDITERKISEQLIIEKNINTKASKVKEEALMNMSFHIRTPLASVVNLIFLLENSRLNPQQKEFLNDLKTSVDDLSIMVNNLLNFSLLAADQVNREEEEIKLKDFLQSLKRLIQIKADNSKLEVAFNMPKKVSSIAYSDPQKITQIVYNLTDNALKNCKGKETLSFQTAVIRQEDDDAIFNFIITDPVTVLSPEQLKEIEDAEKMLEVYSENLTQDNQKDLLNIAMVSKLTTILDGSFVVTSTKEEGTFYKVQLPIKLGKVASLSSGTTPDAPIKILLVEDHFLNQIATKKVLTTWSDYVKVDIAENGMIGVEKFREHGYDLILMDIQMPVMNGIEAAKRIRASSDVPIIALTANASKQESDKCLAIGMNNYVVKPFKPQDLYSKIMNALVLTEA